MIGRASLVRSQEWEHRHELPIVTFPRWSRNKPENVVFLSSETGSLQVTTLNMCSGKRTTITRMENGLVDYIDAFPTASGDEVIWFNDVHGDERGLWLVSPFDGSDARPLMGDNFEPLWCMGIAIHDDGTVYLATSDEDGTYKIWVRTSQNNEPKVLLHSRFPMGIGCEYSYHTCGLSSDGKYLAVWHADQGDMLHHGVRSFRSLSIHLRNADSLCVRSRCM